MTEKRFKNRKMIKNLGVSFRATKKDELHLSDPNRVDGWSIKHLLISEVCFIAILKRVKFCLISLIFILKPIAS